MVLVLVTFLWWQDRHITEPAPLSWETCEQFRINCR